MLASVSLVDHLRWQSRPGTGTTLEYEHREHVLACHLRAQGLYAFGKEEIDVRAPYLVVLLAGERDGNGLVGPVEIRYCRFRADGLRSRGARVELDLGGLRVRRSHVRQLARRELSSVVDRFRRLAMLTRTPHPSAQLEAGAVLLELLALWASPPTGNANVSPASKYRTLIEQHAFDARVALERLAAEVGLSADYLRILFEREYGLAPVRYRNRLRLSRATELLRDRALSVSTIARSVGFPHASYFTSLFRRVHGMSPREFVRRVPSEDTVSDPTSET